MISYLIISSLPNEDEDIVLNVDGIRSALFQILKNCAENYIKSALLCSKEVFCFVNAMQDKLPILKKLLEVTITLKDNDTASLQEEWKIEELLMSPPQGGFSHIFLIGGSIRDQRWIECIESLYPNCTILPMEGTGGISDNYQRATKQWREMVVNDIFPIQVPLQSPDEEDIELFYEKHMLWAHLNAHLPRLEKYSGIVSESILNIFLRKAHILKQLGRDKDILKIYNFLLENIQDSEKKCALLLDRALLYENIGEREEAMRDLRDIDQISMASQDIRCNALYLMANCLREEWNETGEPDLLEKSIQILQQLNTTNPISDSLYLHARNLDDLNKTKDALFYYRCAIELCKNTNETESLPRFYYDMAHCLNDYGADVAYEIECYNDVIGYANVSDELKFDALHNRAVCYEEKGDIEKALYDYRTIVLSREATDDARCKAYINIANIANLQEHYKSARLCSQMALDQIFASEEYLLLASFNHALSLTLENKYKRAFDDFLSIQEDWHPHPREVCARIFFNLAYCCAEMSKADQALEWYQKAIERQDICYQDSVRSRLNMIVLYMESNQYHKIIPMIKELLELNDYMTLNLLAGNIYRLFSQLAPQSLPYGIPTDEQWYDNARSTPLQDNEAIGFITFMMNKWHDLDSSKLSYPLIINLKTFEPTGNDSYSIKDKAA